jgi:hypothetical protein
MKDAYRISEKFDFRGEDYPIPFVLRDSKHFLMLSSKA